MTVRRDWGAISEVLALRWSSIDLDTRVIRVREALEETKQYGIRFKTPKTRAGRRDISLPDIVLATLRDHRRQQLELWLQLGLGKLSDDALLFPEPLTGVPQSPATSASAGTGRRRASASAISGFMLSGTRTPPS
jgi:integrase